MSEITLVSNPGSASRKYAIFCGSELLANIHFEFVKKEIIYSFSAPNKTSFSRKAGISHLTFSATKLIDILSENDVIDAKDKVSKIGLRIVAPSTFFQQHRRLDKRALRSLRDLQPRAPLHISASIQEVELLGSAFPKVPIIGASDSVFHITKPMVTHSYAIPQKDAHELDVWRFSYHGLSLGSVVGQLQHAGLLTTRMIVCHLGSGCSVTALLEGKSMDNTMGYSPLEGLMMSTRSGTIDPTAVEALRVGLGMSRDKTQNYLNLSGGLKGVSGRSDDIRELLELEAKSNKPAEFALSMYVLKVQQAIGQMVATIGGVDTLVFTGTVGERSAEIRKRVCANLSYLGLHISQAKNEKALGPKNIMPISVSIADKQIMIVPSNEALQIASVVEQLA